MGYTVYWRLEKSIPDKELKLIQEAVQLKYEIELKKISVDTNYTLFDLSMDIRTKDYDIEEYFHESFSGEMLYSIGLNFCKTARKLYDKAVKLALIKAQELSNNAWEITCDDGGIYTKDTILELSKHETWLPKK
jgi:hypothetical protein